MTPVVLSLYSKLYCNGTTTYYQNRSGLSFLHQFVYALRIALVFLIRVHMPHSGADATSRLDVHRLERDSNISNG